MHPASHRGRVTVASPFEIPNVQQVCQIQKRVSRRGGAATKRSDRHIGLSGRVPGVPSKQIRNCLARRNTRRAAGMTRSETGFVRRGSGRQAFYSSHWVVWARTRRLIEADSQLPHSSKFPTRSRYVKSRNGVCAKGKWSTSVLTDTLGCPGHVPDVSLRQVRDRRTVGTSGVPRICQSAGTGFASAGSWE
jgi:hypothetical protein